MAGTTPIPCEPASLSPGADINTQASDSASALYEACKNDHEEVVAFLLSQGADANKANKDGLLPLHIASKKGNYRSVGGATPQHSSLGSGEGWGREGSAPALTATLGLGPRSLSLHGRGAPFTGRRRPFQLLASGQHAPVTAATARAHRPAALTGTSH